MGFCLKILSKSKNTIQIAFRGYELDISTMTKRRHITLGLSAILWAGIAILPSTAQAEVVENIPFKAESAVSGINESSPETMTEYLVRRDVSASEAKRIARKRAGGGEVVDISRKGNTYRVRVIRKDGRVVDVLIDARTGRVK